MTCQSRLLAVATAILCFVLLSPAAYAQTETEACLDCHDDTEMTNDDGRFIGVPSDWFSASVHGDHDCIDCHTQEGDYEDEPHFDRYEPVDCAYCHEDETHSFGLNFHAKARKRGNRNAPTCVGCHGVGGNAHRMQELTPRTAENSCRKCHSAESNAYDGGVHGMAAKAGKDSPGCVSCHQSHGPGLPPAAGAISKQCATCHTDAIAAVERGGHFHMAGSSTETLNCTSCHEAHGTAKPTLSPRVAETCEKCHEDDAQAFVGTVHEDLIADGDMNCVSCHSTHVAEGEAADLDAGCASCHEDAEEEYRGSVHRLGRMRGALAATCADCHNGHNILAATDKDSKVHPSNIPDLCSECHSEEPVITSDFVTLPVSVPNYLESVHGKGWKDNHTNGDHGGRTAVCTDCHGSHDMQTAQDPESPINRFNIPETCGQCHTDEANEYTMSIHGRAVELGIEDSPTCTDCHDEHLIKSHLDPSAKTSAEHVAEDLCGDCHTDPALVAKYGVESGVIDSYLDSYHGWAIDRGSSIAATCIDCHTTHEIRSHRDPASAVHPANVTRTCATCHEGATATFAQSYTHASALEATTYHDIARLIYIVLIAVVLGGMALHNFLVAKYEFGKILAHRKKEPYLQRWHKAERIQHLVLLTSFFGLAITGFALRFPEAWWVKLLGLGTHEVIRAYTHRALAVLNILVSVYHGVWILATRRGRWALREMAPRYWDVTQAFQNMMFHLGKRGERPAFKVFDYTQKAEYWALVWGTVVMAFTGFVLWFPTVATQYMPAWVVRVSEVVHFYEAILAVGAIFIWHLFYVLVHPAEYPMSTVWLNGRVPATEWRELHRGEYNEVGPSVIRYPEGHEPEPEERVTEGTPPDSDDETPPGRTTGTEDGA